MAIDDLPSSPAPLRPGATLEEELAFYKAQYEQLESELQEFQASSKELEAELEKDIEAVETRERGLREKVEGLGFEVEEWKTKYKSAKSEAASAQSTLQKEITTLRDTCRTLNLRLRDIEVANDDFERQARNTTSSLEDLESKYNMGIERSVLLEEEIKVGEQEREALRIENQRVRDELSDLKIEAEILQEKLRAVEAEAEQLHQQRTASLTARPTTSDGVSRPRTAGSDTTSLTNISSPTASTPPPSQKEAASPETSTPPSPPLSDSAKAARPNVSKHPLPMTPILARKRGTLAPAGRTLGGGQPRCTPRSATTTTTMPNPPPSIPSTIRAHPRHKCGPSIPMAMTPSAGRAPAIPGSTHRPRPSVSNLPAPSVRASTAGEALPRNGSLYQIRGLITKMSRLEARVHNARSKLPAPTATPPRASPRQANATRLRHATPNPGAGGDSSIGSGSGSGDSSSSTSIPGNVTVRRDRRSRTSNSTVNTSRALDSTSSRPVSRLSFGVSTGAPHERGDAYARPGSALSQCGHVRPPSATGHRAGSVAGHYGARPGSRSSMGGARTPLGNYPTTAADQMRRPTSRTGARSSMSSSVNGAAGQGQGQRYGHSREYSTGMSAAAAEEALVNVTMARWGSAFGKGLVMEGSGIPIPRRLSGGVGGEGGGGEMGPPARVARKLSEVGESY